MNTVKQRDGRTELINVSLGSVSLEGDLTLPSQTSGIVLFAHGSGSSRFSSRNRYVASVLQKEGLGTLLIDLLTAREEEIDAHTRHLRFNISLLSDRLIGAVDWLTLNEETSGLPIGTFGASTGAAAALVAAAERPDEVRAVVSRGGRPDLADPVLDRVRAPTLLIVGGEDDIVIGLNREAFDKLKAEKELVIIPGATHLFEEPGALEQMARYAADWFVKYLVKEPVPRRG